MSPDIVNIEEDLAERKRANMPELQYLRWLVRTQERELQATYRYVATLNEKIEGLEEKLRSPLMVIEDEMSRTNELNDLRRHVDILCREIDRYVQIESTMEELKRVRDEAREVL